MKILIVANGYPTSSDPQFGCFERDQALALNKAGHQVCIIYIDRRWHKQSRKRGFTHIKENGLEVFGLFLFPSHGLRKVAHRLDCFLCSRLLNMVYRKAVAHWGEPDVIYAQFLYNIAFASYLKKRYKIPLVGIEHWSVLNQPELPDDVRYMGEIAYNSADCLIAVSESLRTIIRKQFGKDPVVIYNMVGEEFCNTATLPRKTNTNQFKFVSTGSLIHRKGFDVLISAFAKSGLWKEGCVLNIIGDGPVHQALQQQIEKLGLKENVRLLGRKDKNEIIEILAESDAFVLSSRAETFSVVCIEAMSCGLPVIATACGGPEEFIKKDNGILIQPDNVDELASAMRSIFENIDNYNREAIRTDCLSKFAPQKITSRLIQIFNEVKMNYDNNSK